jgi:hypothetical protein
MNQNRYLLALLLMAGVAACGDDGGGTDPVTDTGTDAGGDTVETDTTEGSDTTGTDTVETDTVDDTVETDTVEDTGPLTCTDDPSLCTDGDICVSGECVPPIDPADYVFSGTLSYISDLKIPSENDVTWYGEDLVGDNGDGTGTPGQDGTPDNGLGRLLGALGPLLGDVDVNGTIAEALADGSISLIVEYRDYADLNSATDLSFFLGDSCDDATTRFSGDGTFSIDPASFGEAGSLIQFNGSSFTDGTLNAGPSLFNLTIPLDSLAPGLVLSLAIEDAKLEAAVEETETGIATVDEDVEIDGETVTYGGGKLSGVVPAAQIFDLLNELTSDCACAGVDPAQAVLSFGEDEETASFVVECTYGAGEINGDACTDEDGALCDFSDEVCQYASLIGGLGLFDYDTNANAIPDAITVGIRVAMVGAALNEAPLDELMCEGSGAM